MSLSGTWVALRHGLDGLWNVPVYRLLLVLICIEVLLVLGQILWLLRQTWRIQEMRRVKARFMQSLALEFFDAIEEPERRVAWIRRARTYPENVIREFVEAYMLRTEGAYREKIVRVYRDIGLLWLDVQDLRSPAWQVRMIALRRMFLAATPAERETLLTRRDDLYPIRIMAATVLARVGTAEDLIEILRDLHLPRRLMEQPLVAMLQGVPVEAYEGLMAGWSRLQSPRLRRIVLIVAARTVPSVCLEWLPAAAEDAEVDVRVGACVAAGQIPVEATRELLLHMLEDTSWEVRAQAASALGEQRGASSIPALGCLLRDPSFWVRQHAALAIRGHGEEGLGFLQEVAASDPDAFARDAARQELERHAMEMQGAGDPPGPPQPAEAGPS